MDLEHITQQEAEMIVSKLYRHYHLGNHSLSFRTRCGGVTGSQWSITLGLDRLSIDTIAHEVAHAIQFSKNCNRKEIVLSDGMHSWKKQHWHGRKHKRIQDRIEAYMKRKDYWQEEIAERLASKKYQPKPMVITVPKPPKPAPTRLELQTKRVEAAKERVKQYERRLRLYMTKLKKANRSLKALERNLGKEPKTYVSAKWAAIGRMMGSVSLSDVKGDGAENANQAKGDGQGDINVTVDSQEAIGKAEGDSAGRAGGKEIVIPHCE